MHELSKDSDGFVRLAVAENPKTAMESLQDLAKDSLAYVRNAAKNRGVI